MKDISHEKIKAIALNCGFTERVQADGTMGLNPYVYEFAMAMFAQGAGAIVTPQQGNYENQAAPLDALYEGTARVVLAGKPNGSTYSVELQIDGVEFGEFPSYTQAAEEVIGLVNQ